MQNSSAWTKGGSTKEISIELRSTLCYSGREEQAATERPRQTMRRTTHVVDAHENIHPLHAATSFHDALVPLAVPSEAGDQDPVSLLLRRLLLWLLRCIGNHQRREDSFDFDEQGLGTVEHGVQTLPVLSRQVRPTATATGTGTGIGTEAGKCREVAYARDDATYEHQERQRME